MKELSYSVIEAAKEGDSDAITQIFKHFEGYIASRCRVTYEDGSGRTYSYVDDDLRYQAEIALYSAIIKFRFKEPPESFRV